jgi:hypothetical protein
MASQTRFAIFGFTEGMRLIVRETVAIETLARSATVRMSMGTFLRVERRFTFGIVAPGTTDRFGTRSSFQMLQENVRILNLQSWRRPFLQLSLRNSVREHELSLAAKMRKIHDEYVALGASDKSN